MRMSFTAEPEAPSGFLQKQLDKRNAEVGDLEMLVTDLWHVLGTVPDLIPSNQVMVSDYWRDRIRQHFDATHDQMRDSKNQLDRRREHQQRLEEDHYNQQGHDKT